MSGIISGIKGTMKKKGGSGIPSTVVILPCITLSNGTYYLHLIKLNGTIAKTYQLPSGISSTDNVIYHRYQSLLYIFPRDKSFYYTCNTANDTVTLTNESYANSNGQWARVQPDRIIRVNGANQNYSVLNLQTGVMTDTSYSAGSSTGIASFHSTLTFYDRSSSGLTNFSPTVKWTAAYQGAPNYTGEINSATFSSSNNTLGSRSTYSDGMNYSRNMSAVGNSSYGFIGRFDGSYYRHTPGSISGTGITVASTAGRNPTGFSGYTPMCLTSNGKMYQTFSGSGAVQIGVYDMLSSTTPPSALVGGDLVYNTTYGCANNTSIFQINDNNYVAVLSQDSSSNVGFIRLDVYDNSATKVATFSINVSSYSNTSTIMYSNGLCELGTYLPGSTYTQ